MEKISDFISKKVISLREGERIGYILDIVYNENFTMCEGFIVVDEESENTFMLFKNDIKATGEDCIVIESVNVLDINVINTSLNPIGKPVYDKNGLMLGVVKDVIMSSFHIKKIITNKCEIPLRYICKVGRDCIVYGKKTNLKVKPNFHTNGKKLPTVYIEDQIDKIDSDNVIKINNGNKNFNYDAINPTKPIRLFANTSSLIGKEIKTDIFGYNHEVIIRKYEKITQNVINKAKLHNKLNFLIFYSE